MVETEESKVIDFNTYRRKIIKSTKKKRVLPYISLLMNLTVAVLSLVGTIMSFFKNGFSLFLFYTVDSNILASIACFLLSFYILRKIINNKDIPKFAQTLKFVGVCCLTLTFLVVVFILAPTYGSGGLKILLFKDELLFHHFICPIIAIISFFVFDRVPKESKKAAVDATIPTFIYALVLVALNAAKLVYGPYPFLHVYEQSIYTSVIFFIFIVGGNFLFAYLFSNINKIIHQ